MAVKTYHIILLFSLILGCKKPFSQKPKTALVLPTQVLPPSIVFITGTDHDNNTYYSNAKTYFKAQHMQIIEGLSSLNAIIDYLNASSVAAYKDIHIVSHSNPWLGMALKTTKNGVRITTATLTEAIATQQILPLCHGIDSSTKIIFHACGLAHNNSLLKTLKRALSNAIAPQLVASPFFNVFGGKYEGHYLATPYYTYYPTAESPGPRALAKTLKQTYPKTKIDWFKAITTRRETAFGTVYSYTFNIPIHWEFSFNDRTEIPKLSSPNTIMDWVVTLPEMAQTLYNLGIPLTQYRWRHRIKDHTLHIYGKTTVLCVLAPIINPNDPSEYKSIAFNDTTLYNTL
jgi:hypothetical protein